jgi:hypothetical protein
VRAGGGKPATTAQGRLEERGCTDAAVPLEGDCTGPSIRPHWPCSESTPTTQAAVLMVMNLYDPSLPPVEGPDDLQPIHIDWAEDQALEACQR